MLGLVKPTESETIKYKGICELIFPFYFPSTNELILNSKLLLL